MAPPASPREHAGPDRLLLALTAAAVVVRVGFLILEPATHPVADERTWTDWARNLMSEKVRFSPLRTHMIFYPPLYPYFLAASIVVGGGLEAAKWFQAVLGGLLVPAVGLVGARAFSPRVGWIAAAITAFYPELVWFSVHFWSETLFMLLLWWGFERLLAADDRGSAALAALAGGLWGIAILTRETVLYFLPVVAAWLAVSSRPRARVRGAAFLLTALLVIAPWTYRNWLAFRAFVPVSTAGGLNLFQGNALLTRQEVYDLYEAVHGRIAQYRFARAAGLAAIRERQPWWLFEKLRDEMPRFWEGDSLALIHVKRGAYGAVHPAAAVAAALVVLTPYLAVLAFFVVGGALLRGARGPMILILFLVYYNLIHVAAHGFARYRLPAMPVVFLVAALGLSGWRSGLLIGLSPRRRVAAAVLAAILGVSLVPSFRQNFGHPVFGFRDAGGPPGEENP